jgi:hypothetical protein
MTNNIQKTNVTDGLQLDLELTTLSFIKDYNPVILAYTFRIFKNFNFEKCIAFLIDKSTVRYLLLAGIDEVSSVKEKFKRTTTLTTPSETKLEISRLKKSLERSKKILFSQGEELAKNEYVSNCNSLLSVYKFGIKNVANVLPFVSDETIANAIYLQGETKFGLLTFLPKARITRIRLIQKNSNFSYKKKSESINSIIKELNRYLLHPISFGVDPFTLDLKSYKERVIDFLHCYPVKALQNVLEQSPINLIVNSLKILDPIDQFNLLKFCSIEKAKYVFEQYFLSPEINEFSFKAFNKLAREVQRVSAKLETASDVLLDDEKIRTAYTFDDFNKFDEKVWLQLVHDVSLKQIYFATCKARDHESLSAFMEFIKAKSIHIDYQQLDQNYDVTSSEVLDFQNEILEECRRIQDMYDDIELSALEEEIMACHGISKSKKKNGGDENKDRALGQQDFVEVYNHQALMEEIVLGLKDQDARIFQKIQDKGCSKKVVYVPDDYKKRLESLTKAFPNFAQVIEFIQGSFTESYLTSRKIDLPVINLNGNPGIGKSQMIIEFSSMFSLYFNSLPVTSMGDKFELIGAHRTWNNASIGAFAKALLMGGDTSQPCFLIDELCMVKNKGERNLVPTLLNLFESQQSKSVTENFLGIEVDFSGMIIFTTTNNIENLVPALRSRIVSFDIPNPSSEQMELIGSNIYSKYRKEKQLEGFLSEKIPTTCFKLFINEPPRQAKQLLIAAIRHAIQRVDVKSNMKVSLEPSDFQYSSNHSSSKTIGFVH